VSAPPALFTIGHGDRPIAAFVDMLRDAGVTTLVDVRRHPGSRRHPQFAREALAHSLAAAGIAYSAGKARRWAGGAARGPIRVTSPGGATPFAATPTTWKRRLSAPRWSAS
jgi:hypothetical protein